MTGANETVVRGITRVVDESVTPEELEMRVCTTYGDGYVRLARQIAAEKKGFGWLNQSAGKAERLAGKTAGGPATSSKSHPGDVEAEYFAHAKVAGARAFALALSCFVGFAIALAIGTKGFGGLALVLLAVGGLAAPIAAWYGIPVLTRAGFLPEHVALQLALVLLLMMTPTIGWFIDDAQSFAPINLVRFAYGSGTFVAICFVTGITGYATGRVLQPVPGWRRSQVYLGLALGSFCFSGSFGLFDRTVPLAIVGVILSCWLGYFLGRVTRGSRE